MKPGSKSNKPATGVQAPLLTVQGKELNYVWWDDYELTCRLSLVLSSPKSAISTVLSSSATCLPPLSPPRCVPSPPQGYNHKQTEICEYKCRRLCRQSLLAKRLTFQTLSEVALRELVHFFLTRTSFSRYPEAGNCFIDCGTGLVSLQCLFRSAG